MVQVYVLWNTKYKLTENICCCVKKKDGDCSDEKIWKERWVFNSLWVLGLLFWTSRPLNNQPVMTFPRTFHSNFKTSHISISFFLLDVAVNWQNLLKAEVKILSNVFQAFICYFMCFAVRVCKLYWKKMAELYMLCFDCWPNIWNHMWIFNILCLHYWRYNSSTRVKINQLYHLIVISKVNVS